MIKIMMMETGEMMAMEMIRDDLQTTILLLILVDMAVEEVEEEEDQEEIVLNMEDGIQDRDQDQTQGLQRIEMIDPEANLEIKVQ